MDFDEFEERFETLERAGGRIIRDLKTDITSKDCPFCHVGDCVTDSTACLKDYESCRIYKERTKSGRGS